MKKHNIKLTDKEISHIESALDLMIQGVTYGEKAYREYTALEASIKKSIREATQPLTDEALKDIRRTLERQK